MVTDVAVSSPLQWYGSKTGSADLIVSCLPKHRHYVELFGGSAAVLLAKPRAKLETFNDLDGDVTNLFRVLRDPTLADQLTQQITLTPYARSEWEAAHHHITSSTPGPDPDVERARLFLVAINQSVGRTPTSTGWRRTLHAPEGSPPATRWAQLPPKITTAAARFVGVQVENRPWHELLPEVDRPGVVVYLDPPYPPTTRRGGHRYRIEMTEDDHHQLVTMVRELRHAKTIISGYDHPRWNELEAAGWTRHEMTVLADDHGHGDRNRTEVLWLSDGCGFPQASLFDRAS